MIARRLRGRTVPYDEIYKIVNLTTWLFSEMAVKSFRTDLNIDPRRVFNVDYYEHKKNLGQSLNFCLRRFSKFFRNFKTKGCQITIFCLLDIATLKTSYNHFQAISIIFWYPLCIPIHDW